MSISITTPTSTLLRTTVVAGAVHAAGGPLAAKGQVPIAAFAQFTFIGAVLGGIILAVVNRRRAAPGRRFLQIVGGLTALSLVPAIVYGDNAASKIGLVATHLLAAAIIVPALARHITD